MTRDQDLSASKWGKLRTRVANDGVGGLSRWAVQWAYWNGRVHQVLPPESLNTLRNVYKYRKRTKKFGINDPILVYQMGKVGSTTIYYSLKALDLDVPVTQLHFLSDMERHEAHARRKEFDPPRGESMVEVAKQIRREMNAHPDRKWNLIIPIRAPLPRKVSVFFENIRWTFPDFRARYESNSLTVQELTDYFLNDFNDDAASYWFDLQLKPVFGIDVYATPFDKARGYQIYAQGNVRFLIMRMEDLDRVAAPAMQEFLNIPNFRLFNRNVREQRPYAELYREFTTTLRLTPEYVEHIQQRTPYASHFYTPDELAASVARWTKARSSANATL